MSFELPRRWSTVVNVIDYMPGDTLLHLLTPVVKLGLAAAIIDGIF